MQVLRQLQELEEARQQQTATGNPASPTRAAIAHDHQLADPILCRSSRRCALWMARPNSLESLTTQNSKKLAALAAPVPIDKNSKSLQPSPLNMVNTS